MTKYRTIVADPPWWDTPTVRDVTPHLVAKP